MPNRIFSVILYGAATAVLLTIITNCCHIKTTATVKTELTSFEKTAIIWQGNNDYIYETLFLSCWMETFPQQILVERKELHKVISEQNLMPGRLNEKTRARIRKVLGVDAIVIARFNIIKKNQLFDKNRTDLSIKVVDTETGEISVSAISTGKSYCNDSIIIEAVRKIKDQMTKNAYSTSPHRYH